MHKVHNSHLPSVNKISLSVTKQWHCFSKVRNNIKFQVSNNHHTYVVNWILPKSTTPPHQISTTRAKIVEAWDNKLVRRFIEWQTRDRTCPPSKIVQSIIVQGTLVHTRGNSNNQYGLNQAGYVQRMENAQIVATSTSNGDSVSNPPSIQSSSL